MRYVRNGDVRLAYRVYGDGGTTLVWVPTVLSSIDRYDDPAFPWGAFVERLSREIRVVVYDARGTGLSDPVSGAPSLDHRVQDLSCVVEAAGATPTSLFAPFTGGSQSLAFAARHPERSNHSSCSQLPHGSPRIHRISHGASPKPRSPLSWKK